MAPEVRGSGLPIEVISTYDSRDKSAGDFGPGWNASLRNIRVESSGTLGKVKYASESETRKAAKNGHKNDGGFGAAELAVADHVRATGWFRAAARIAGRARLRGQRSLGQLCARAQAARSSMMGR
jgi:hypothetical protein